MSFQQNKLGSRWYHLFKHNVIQFEHEAGPQKPHERVMFNMAPEGLTRSNNRLKVQCLLDDMWGRSSKNTPGGTKILSTYCQKPLMQALFVELPRENLAKQSLEPL